MEDQSMLKAKIKNWLKETNTTQQTLAKLCEVSVPTITNWLGKKKIPLSKIALLKSIITNIATVTKPAVETVTTAEELKATIISNLSELKKSEPDIDYTMSVYSLIGILTLK